MSKSGTRSGARPRQLYPEIGTVELCEEAAEVFCSMRLPDIFRCGAPAAAAAAPPPPPPRPPPSTSDAPTVPKAPAPVSAAEELANRIVYHPGMEPMGWSQQGPLDEVIANVEAMEERLFSRCFQSICDTDGLAEVTSAPLQYLIVRHTALNEEESHASLMKASANGKEVEFRSFLELLQNHPIRDQDAIEQFLNYSSDGVTVTVAECCAQLRSLVMKAGAAEAFSSSTWAKIFASILAEGGMEPSLPQWLRYCRITARIARLVKLADCHL